MIDAYLVVAASVLASSTVIRSLFGAGFPVSRAFALYERVTDAVSPFLLAAFWQSDVYSIKPSNCFDCPWSCRPHRGPSPFLADEMGTGDAQEEPIRHGSTTSHARNSHPSTWRQRPSPRRGRGERAVGGNYVPDRVMIVAPIEGW